MRRRRICPAVDARGAKRAPPIAPMTAEPRFLLYSRPGCGLCEEMMIELQAQPAARNIPIDIVDVDQDRAARARFGHKIPVLLCNGELVCHGRLDVEELHKALAPRR